jgi:hypothetical protein
LNQKDDEPKKDHFKIFTHQRNDSRRPDQVVVYSRVQQISGHAKPQRMIDRRKLINDHHTDEKSS